MALIVVASLAAIQSVQQNGEERLEASDARVSASNGADYPGASTSTTVGATTTTVGGQIDVHLASTPLITIVDDGTRWQVTLTFTLLDSSGNGVIGATMNGAWTDVGQGSNPIGNCTTSTSAGQCTVVYTRIKDSDNTVDYDLASITGGGFQWVPEALGEGSVTVTCGSPIC